jgi:hypothetical protein
LTSSLEDEGEPHFVFSSAFQFVTSDNGILAVGKFTVEIRKRFPSGVTSKLKSLRMVTTREKASVGLRVRFPRPFLHVYGGEAVLQSGKIEQFFAVPSPMRHETVLRGYLIDVSRIREVGKVEVGSSCVLTRHVSDPLAVGREDGATRSGLDQSERFYGLR